MRNACRLQQSAYSRQIYLSVVLVLNFDCMRAKKNEKRILWKFHAPLVTIPILYVIFFVFPRYFLLLSEQWYIQCMLKLKSSRQFIYTVEQNYSHLPRFFFYMLISIRLNSHVFNEFIAIKRSIALWIPQLGCYSRCVLHFDLFFFIVKISTFEQKTIRSCA